MHKRFFLGLEFTGGSTVAVISSLSGTQAEVTPVISGLGKVTEVNVNTAGTNYRNTSVYLMILTSV